jgi:hypothetical protein
MSTVIKSGRAARNDPLTPICLLGVPLGAFAGVRLAATFASPVPAAPTGTVGGGDVEGGIAATAGRLAGFFGANAAGASKKSETLVASSPIGSAY